MISKAENKSKLRVIFIVIVVAVLTAGCAVFITEYNGRSGIYEIRITFDDHSYKENYYEQFKELCLCTEKLLLPELSQEDLQSLLEKLIAQSEVNLFGDHAAFSAPGRPALDKVYRVGNTGVYGFYGSGNIEVWFVPLIRVTLPKMP